MEFKDKLHTAALPTGLSRIPTENDVSTHTSQEITMHSYHGLTSLVIHSLQGWTSLMYSWSLPSAMNSTYRCQPGWFYTPRKFRSWIRL